MVGSRGKQLRAESCHLSSIGEKEFMANGYSLASCKVVTIDEIRPKRGKSKLLLDFLGNGIV